MPATKDLIIHLLSGDDHRAEQSACSFIDHGQEGLQALFGLYASKDPDTRWWALRALACFPAGEYPQVGKCLALGLLDSDVSVQTCAAAGLREHPSPTAAPRLITLLDHQDKLLARLAGDALAALKNHATSALIEFVQETGERHSNGKLEAVRALALIGDPASISLLFQVWENGSSMVQYWAERGLNDMGVGMVFFDPLG